MKLKKDEKEIISFLKKIKRTFNILIKLSKKKISLYTQMYSEAEKLNRLYEAGIFKKLFQSKKTETEIKKFKLSAKRMQNLLHRQINLLPEEQKRIQNDKQVLNGTRKIFLSSLEEADKQVDEEFLNECETVLQHFLKGLGNVYLRWKNAYESLNSFEHTPLKLKTRIQLGFSRSEINEELEFFEKSIPHIDRLIKKTYDLINLHKEFKEYKHVFNPAELEIIMKQAHKLKLYEKGRYTKEILKKERAYGNIDINKLALVHLTPTFPENGIIRPSYNFKDFVKGFLIKRPRTTIHFTINCIVQEQHAWEEGVWADADKTAKISTGSEKEIKGHVKYAIIVPLKNIINRVAVLKPADTWIYGSLRLTQNCDIIGKPKYLQGYEHKKGAAHIIKIPDNSDIRKEIISILSAKGYEPMNLGQHDWIGSYEQENNEHIEGGNIREALHKISDSHRIKTNISHFYSTETEIERFFSKLYSIIMKDANKPAFGGGWKRLAQESDYYKGWALELLVKLRKVRKEREARNIVSEEKDAFQYLEKRLKRTFKILSKLEKRYKS